VPADGVIPTLARTPAQLAWAPALPAPVPTNKRVILRVRKLFPVPVLACLVAVPVAFGATPSPDTDGERAMITAPLGNDPLDAAEARSRLKAAERDARRAAERAARPETTEAPATPAAAVPPQLEAIAACESGGNPQAVGGGGAYRGKYQFSTSTWAAVGGSGDPAAAPEGEQDRRAAMLYAQSGAGQWPVCGS
jgi:hypothetical protein